jgi:hypothetical protein
MPLLAIQLLINLLLEESLFDGRVLTSFIDDSKEVIYELARVDRIRQVTLVTSGDPSLIPSWLALRSYIWFVSSRDLPSIVNGSFLAVC